MGFLLTIWYTVAGLFFKAFLWGTVIYVIYTMGLLFTKKRKQWIFTKCVAEFVFCCYLVALLTITGISELRPNDFSDIHATPNLIPLISTMKDFFNYGFSVLKQVTLNIVLFIPFGVLISILIYKNKKSFIKVFTSSLIVSGGIETIQYFCGRFADIDDVISNVIGALIGYLVYIIWIKVMKNKTRLCK